MQKRHINILDLHDILLLYLFTFLPVGDLYFVRFVCKRFYHLATLPELWKTISVNAKLPTCTLRKIIKSTPCLKSFKAKNRHDANVIAKEIARHCRDVESITLKRCSGWSNRLSIFGGKIFTKLISKCPMLVHCDFTGSRFYSTYFFRTINKTEPHRILKKKWRYTGPITKQQLRAILNGIENFDENFVEFHYKGSKLKLEDAIHKTSSS